LESEIKFEATLQRRPMRVTIESGSTASQGVPA